uniref:hypothetical protein n=1 Tax=Lentzea alba TaxID=2714351 RepID=UPI0039BFC68D
MKQSDLESDAKAHRLVSAPESVAAEPAGRSGGGVLDAGHRRWRLLGRVRPA